jgi:serine/threonine protein kinase
MVTEALASQVRLPKRIGRYDAFLRLGVGGMAWVYLASESRTSELAVIKQLRHDIADDEQVRTMFMDEARIAIRLDHPNVVRTKDIVANPPDYYLVMEFLEGQSLLELLKRVGRRNVPRDEHLWILTEILRGLEYAHGMCDADGRALGVVHRDVNPPNVVVCYSGAVKLVDFGIAKASGALTATAQGLVKGKIGYASPEQCLGLPAKPASDLYAVGIMLWEAVARRRRATGPSWEAVLESRLAGAEPDLEQVVPDVPPELLEITRRALARDPAARYASAAEFREALEEFLGESQVAAGQANVARLMSSIFAADALDLRRAIDAHFERRSGPPSDRRSTLHSFTPAADEGSATRARTHPLAAPDVPSEYPAPSFDEDTAPIPVDDALLTLSRSRAPSSIPPAAHPDEGDRTRKLGAGLVGAVALVAFVAALTSRALFRKDLAPAVPSGTAETLASVTPPVAVVPPNAPAPRVVQRIHVRLHARPRSAIVMLDGQPLSSNPFVAALDRDDRMHIVTATADGYETASQGLIFDDDVDFQMDLRPRWVHGIARPPIRAAVTPRSAPSEQSPHMEPGVDLGPAHPRRGGHAIDEADPYAR